MFILDFIIAVVFLVLMFKFLAIVKEGSGCSNGAHKRGIKVEESYHYRKHLGNMYVAGVIRNKADEDNVDIDEETNKFMDYLSSFTPELTSDIDNSIEDDLAQKVSDVVSADSKTTK